MMNWRYVLGTTTMVVIIGGVVYSIKKSKEIQENAISIEEAMKEVRERRVQQGMYDDDDGDIQIIIDDARDEASWNASFSPPREDTELAEEDDIMDIGIEQEEYEVQYVPFDKERDDSELRHDPNSNDALDQYINMELAGLPEGAWNTMRELFEFPFQPITEGDRILKTKLCDYRAQFFGLTSKWIVQPSYADVIFHYARATQYNIGESLNYWVEYFLEFGDMSYIMTSGELEQRILDLNSHVYFNEEAETYGLFGLTERFQDAALDQASRTITGALEYDIEFNEFLKSCINI